MVRAQFVREEVIHVGPDVVLRPDRVIGARAAAETAIPIGRVHPVDRLDVLQGRILEAEEPVFMNVGVLRDDGHAIAGDPAMLRGVEDRRPRLLRAGDERVERVAAAGRPVLGTVGVREFRLVRRRFLILQPRIVVLQRRQVAKETV